MTCPCCQEKCGPLYTTQCCTNKNCTIANLFAKRSAAVVTFGARTWTWPTSAKTYCIPYYEEWKRLIDGLVVGTVTLANDGSGLFRYFAPSQIYQGQAYIPLEVRLLPINTCINANMPFWDGAPTVECCVRYSFNWTARFPSTPENCYPCNGFFGNPNNCQTSTASFSNRGDAVIAQGSLCGDGLGFSFLDQSNTMGGSGTAFCCIDAAYSGFVSVSFV